MRELWHGAWVGLCRRRLRSALTIGGIAIGTAMVMLICGISAVGERAIQNELECMGINGLSVSASEGLTMPCLTSIRKLPGVSEAMPLMVKYASVCFDFGGEYSVASCGIDAGADQVISLELLHGRLLSREDVAAEAAVCVVDEALALEAFGRSNIVGCTLTLVPEGVSRSLTVVGVTATGSSLLQTVTAMIPYMVYIPYSTMQTAVGNHTFDQIAVRISDGTKTEQAERAIQRALAISGENIGTLSTENLAAQRQRLDSMVSIISWLLTAIGGVSLLVSGFGIMTAMLSSVQERTREIGIKKAIGATRGCILTEFLMSALIISGTGGLAGLLLGSLGVGIGCLVLGLAPVWSILQIAGIFGLTLLLGVLFGSYPAYKAACLRPVDALRKDM